MWCAFTVPCKRLSKWQNVCDKEHTQWDTNGTHRMAPDFPYRSLSLLDEIPAAGHRMRAASPSPGPTELASGNHSMNNPHPH